MPRWENEEERCAASERMRVWWSVPENRERRIEQARKRQHSEATKHKIGAANRGKKMSPEAVEKGAAARRGRKALPQTRAALARAARGPRSEETRRKMSQARKAMLSDPDKMRALVENARAIMARLTPEKRKAISDKGRLANMEKMRLRTPTSIEMAVAKILSDFGVCYEQQVIFQWYVADIYLPDYHTIIECDGDYWHSTPKAKSHDAKRDKWFAKHNIQTIRLKECDIRADVEKCVSQALEGIL